MATTLNSIVRMNLTRVTQRSQPACAHDFSRSMHVSFSCVRHHVDDAAGSYNCDRAACGARRAVRAGPLLRGVSRSTAACAAGHRGRESGKLLSKKAPDCSLAPGLFLCTQMPRTIQRAIYCSESDCQVITSHQNGPCSSGCLEPDGMMQGQQVWRAGVGTGEGQINAA